MNVPCMDVSALARDVGAKVERVAVSMSVLSVFDRTSEHEHKLILSRLLAAIFNEDIMLDGPKVEKQQVSPGIVGVVIPGQQHRWFVLDVDVDAKVLVTIWDIFGAKGDVKAMILGKFEGLSKAEA